MPRLESLFSEQVTQPYLNKPFPVRAVEPHDDRIFKHVTFREDDRDGTYRLRPINRNYRTESSVVQKRVTTPVEGVPLFRIKTVLSQPQDGVEESNWITQKSTEEQPASTHNQYRLRGVSKENWKSDWVYSELRDEENDLIVYNMLYDMIDLLSTVHDDQIDYLLDYMVTDTFKKIIYDKDPQFARSLELEDIHEFTMEELLHLMTSTNALSPSEELFASLGENFRLLSDSLKEEFHENVLASPKEFTDLYRVYKLLDQFQHTKKDAVGMLMEIFLEDRLEKLLQKTNIEVLLQNDEEMGIYLSSAYEFNIQNELITSAYDASLNDHFVSSINDAVQLVSEPVVTETLQYGKSEEVSQFFRLVLTELYAPIAAIDERLLELEHDLEDHHQLSVTGSVVEFATMQDDWEIRHSILSDVIETLIKGDTELRYDYELEMVDYLVEKITDHRKALLIDYAFDEVLSILLDAGESFRHAYTTSFGTVQEEVHAQLVESWQYQDTLRSRFAERYQASLFDTVEMSYMTSITALAERTHVSFIEQILSSYDMFKKSIKEQLQASVWDGARTEWNIDEHVTAEDIWAHMVDHLQHAQTSTSQNMQDDIVAHATMDVAWRELERPLVTRDALSLSSMDYVQHADIYRYVERLERFGVLSEDVYENLFKHHLRDPNRYPILEDRHVELAHDIRDIFIMDGSELLEYTLGDIDNDWPVGLFRLGVNTLKGEASRS